MSGGAEPSGRSPERWWLGSDGPPERSRRFRVGPLEFDLRGIDIRHVSFDGREVLNRIYVGIRDVDWDTLPPVVEGLEVRTLDDGSVAVTFEARHGGSGIDLSWRGSITASTDGRIAYVMDATAHTAFRYNRIGFCVLHPASVAGRPHRASTPGGPVEGVLPVLIAPQSIVDGVEIPLFAACSSLEVDLEGVTVATTFEGDLFEMEDQRNWSDGSFKTYCTPIALGYPHHAQAGQVLRQRVDVSVAPRSAVAPRRPRLANGDAPIEVRVGKASGRTWPRFGLGLDIASRGSDGRLPTPVQRALREAGLDHVRVDLHLGQADWSSRLDHARADASAIDARLEVALFVGEDMVAELERAAVSLSRPDVARVIALHEPTAGTATTPDVHLRAVADAFVAAGAGAPPVLTGTNGDFAEINRDRPVPGPWAGVAYAMNPQVHATDEITLVESLPIHAQTVATARSFVGARAVVASPITLRGRFNPAAADPSAGPAEPPVDPRQPSLFAAGWLLGSIASLVGGGADAVTWFETHGPRGVMDPFGTPYPTWFVLADLADRAGWEPVSLEPGTGPVLAGIAMVRPGATRVLLANLTPDRRRARIDGLPHGIVDLRSLDAATAEGAVASPEAFLRSGRRLLMEAGALTVELEPFACVRIDASTGDSPAERRGSRRLGQYSGGRRPAITSSWIWTIAATSTHDSMTALVATSAARATNAVLRFASPSASSTLADSGRLGIPAGIRIRTSSTSRTPASIRPDSISRTNLR